ncbi:uncharacterized protein LOC142498599 [Ascaphus truei]|uniref:uncharacterized protein LOC142498599 n=1 Tax=Ascaphus truei TaxID=8439 RepID=UPI003F5953E6
MASQKEEVSTNQEIDVINISGEDLTTAELSLLRKGLKYAPTMDFDLFNTAIDVHKFVRKLTLKSFFHKRSQFVGPTDDNSLDTVGGVNLSGAPPTPHPEDSEAPIGDPAPSTPSFREACDLQDMLDLEELLYDNDVSSEQIVIPEFSNWRSNLKKGSVFDPQFSKGPFLTTFENLVIRDLRILAEGYSLTNVGKHNLNYKEKQALLSLQKNSRIVIKNADKGGAVVVQSRAAYLKEAYRQLGDATTYSALPDDPTERFLKSYKELLEVGAITQVLNKTENTFLWNPNPIIPVFYHLPKVHKTLVDPPGRPIISSIGSLGDGLSKYIDQYLQPFVKNLPSFLLDSGDLIRKLKNVKWNPQFIWVTMDVTSLYSVIRHDQGVAAVEHFIGGPDSNHFHTSEELCHRFHQRGYNLERLNNIRKEVASTNREDLLNNRQEDPTKDPLALSKNKINRGTNFMKEDVPLMITQYNRCSSQIQKIIRNHWNILQMDGSLKECVKKGPRFVYRKTRKFDGSPNQATEFKKLRLFARATE